MDHLLLVELFQGLEVKMPETLVPAPRLIIPARGKVEELHHLHMEHVKAVASLVHLGEEAATSILDV
jgi:hypothetical protein